MSLTRASLYAQVWAEPMTHLAKRYGVADWKLRQVCARHNIPMPPSGWWTQQRLGRAPDQPPLPSGDDVTIELPRPSAREDGPQIVVPANVSCYHPLVEQTRQVLKGLKPGTPPDRPLLIPREKALYVAVSKALVPRVLRIMDAFVRACERRGYQPSLFGKAAGLKLTIDGQVVIVGIQEKTKQQIRPRTDWEQRGFEKGWYKREPYTLVPTGRLALQIRSSHGGGYVSYELIEGANTPLEESLGRFMSKVLEDAAQSKAREEQWARQCEEAAQRERLRLEEEARERKEQEKADQWDSWMADWHKAQEVRAFARAIEERHGPIEAGGELAEWLAWAERYAERLDPLTKGRDAQRPRGSGAATSDTD